MMRDAVPVTMFLAAHGGEAAAALVAAGRNDPAAYEAADWIGILGDERRILIPFLPPKLRRAIDADAAALTEALRGEEVERAQIERHAEMAAAALRMLVAAAPKIAERIYLDNAATTPVDPRVARVVERAMLRDFGNPHSADHAWGDEAADAVENARGEVASLLGCAPDEVYFTGGASESIRLGLRHLVRRILAHRGEPARVVYLPIEHRAVLTELGELAEAGHLRAIPLSVDAAGRVVDAPEGSFDLLVCMGGNNEIGNVYPIADLAEIARRRGAMTFCDLTQYAGKEPIELASTPIDAAVMSAHKIYGPKGAGALVLRNVAARGFELPSGTPPTPAIVGLGEASRLRRLEMATDEARIAALRDRLAGRLLGAGLGIVRNGDLSAQLSGALHVSIPHCWSDAALAYLRGCLAASTTAACASGRGMSSHVLEAMGLPPWRIRGAMRLGLGRFTTPAEIDAAGDLIVDAVHRVRS